MLLAVMPSGVEHTTKLETALARITWDDVMDAACASGLCEFGLRVVESATVGEELDPSRVWCDGDPTDKCLDGTSAVHLPIIDTVESLVLAEDDIARAIRNCRPYLWIGGVIALVGGNYAAGGEDDNERVIRMGGAGTGARVLATWEIR